MRIAALYDIHGNLPALEAVLRDVRREGVERVVIGGDVLPGPLPHETLACLLDLEIPVQFIRGNGDRAVLAQRAGSEPLEVPEAFREVIRWNALQLTSEEASFMAAWPPTLRVERAGWGDVLFCHATPRNDTEVFTRLTAEAHLVPVFRGVDAPVVVCGHTHMQFDRTVGNTRVVNAGSVGMPYQEPGAYWLLLGPDVQLRYTPYDLESAAIRIRGSNSPDAESFAANNVLQPPAESQMLERMAEVELKV